MRTFTEEVKGGFMQTFSKQRGEWHSSPRWPIHDWGEGLRVECDWFEVAVMAPMPCI